jgi:hypothetical protein
MKGCVLFLCLVALCPVAYGGSHTTVTVSRYRSGSVHVGGYYRHNGTYVAPYSRSTPSHTQTYYPPITSHPRTYQSGGFTPHATVERDSRGRIKRSESAKNDFKREHPCPATGRNLGACPGYVIDHVNPLECGGVDAHTNMQWQSIAAGKAKDRTEGSCR